MTTDDAQQSYDVVIIGGALSGGATATLLLRQNPGIRVLIVEKSAQLSRRVGEATVEVSAYFMGRVLGLTQYLNECQLVKQGLRFWFANDEVKNLEEASELGGRYQVRLPSYQLDRATFDEEVLRRACVAGAELLRPASVMDVQLSDGGEQTITLKNGEGPKTIRARWIVDASGMAAVLARKNGWWKSNTAHPTAAAWSRWKGVKDWDGRELAEKFPKWASAVYGVRGTATNHVIGDGWWSWWIPLKGGDMSVGVVFDQRLVDWPQDGRGIGERLKAFLMEHPVGREMLVDAVWDESDVHWRKNLAYYSTTFAGDGFVLVGDAAAFMDPFYSPGMDWISFTATSAAELITAQRRGEPMREADRAPQPRFRPEPPPLVRSSLSGQIRIHGRVRFDEPRLHDGSRFLLPRHRLTTFQNGNQSVARAAVFRSSLPSIFLFHPRLQSPLCPDRPAPPATGTARKNKSQPALPHSRFHTETHRRQSTSEGDDEMGVAGTDGRVA